MPKKKSFLICPVRDANNKQLVFIDRIVKHLENSGWEVHWPYRDTEQVDPTGGLHICQDNMDAIGEADTVHVIWTGSSRGSMFDFGMAFSMGKRIVPLAMPSLPNGKSLESVLWRYYQEQVGEAEEAEPWMQEVLTLTDEDEELRVWDHTLMEGLEEDECWGEEDEELDLHCCDWMKTDANDEGVLYEEYYRSLSIDEKGNCHQDSNFYIRGNPYPIHHCPGCGRRLDNE